MNSQSTPENGFKLALRSRQLQIGLWLGLADPYAAELCAGSGFDWLLIDGEHAPNDLLTILATLQAVDVYPSQPVVRIPHGDPALIKQILEVGATTLLVPMVESAAQARELVRAMRYPPHGQRGVGSGLARSSRWTRYKNYLQEANERVCLLVQVETVAALAQIEEIAAVDGVDGLFIGPADLAASMGHLGEPTHPQVRVRSKAQSSALQMPARRPVFCAPTRLWRAVTSHWGRALSPSGWIPHCWSARQPRWRPHSRRNPVRVQRRPWTPVIESMRDSGLSALRGVFKRHLMNAGRAVLDSLNPMNPSKLPGMEGPP